MQNSNIKFSTLDSLRGFAAIAVSVFHFNGDWSGYLAVDFFLVLSGFIISHSYLYKKDVTAPMKFISNRIARLYPLHIFTLFTFIFASAFVLKSFPAYAQGTIYKFIQNITFTQNIGLSPSGLSYNYPKWSISVEFLVNIIFIFFITRDTKSATLLILAFIGILVPV